MSEARNSYVSVSAHAGQGSLVRCHTYPDTSPILSVSLPGVCLSISLADREAQACEQAVTFARELARAAEQFAAEAERLYGPDGTQAAA